MKIIHCADLHLDSRMTSNLTKEKARERKAELLNTFQRMIQYAVKNQVSAIIIAGDLFDTKNISAAARNVVKDAVTGHPGIQFYYLKGNHDAESFLSDLEEMPENLKLFGAQWTSYTLDAAGAGNVVISGVELDRQNSESVYNALSLDLDRFNIVVLHGQETEGAGRDNAEVIQLRRLRNKGIDYLALGHIHSYKSEALDSRGRYCYCGCLEGRGFDECGEHGFVLLDINEDKKTCRETFIPIADRNLYTLEVNVEGCMTSAEIADRMKEALEGAGYSSRSLLKIVLTGSIDVECEKNMDLLLKRFESDYYFMKIYDETRFLVDYNDFALDQSLKGEFVRTVMGAEDLGAEEKAVIIRYGIQALAGENLEEEEAAFS